MRAWLPAATNREILEAEVVEKGTRSLLKCCTIWENCRVLSQSLFPLGNLEENPATSARPESKAATRVSAPIQSTVPWELQAAAERSPRQLSFSPGHCQASGSLLTTRRWGGPCPATGHVASRARRSCKRTGQYFGDVSKRESPFSPGLLLVSHVSRSKCFLSPNFRALSKSLSPNQSLLPPISVVLVLA